MADYVDTSLLDASGVALGFRVEEATGCRLQSGRIILAER